MTLHSLRLGGVYELEVHACGDDDVVASLLRRGGDADHRSVALPPPPQLLQMEVTACEAQEALVPDVSEVKRTLAEGKGSVRPCDLFEAELLVGACDDEGMPVTPPVPVHLNLSGPGQPEARVSRRALMSSGESADAESQTDAAAAALDRCARRMLRGEVALVHAPSLRQPRSACQGWASPIVGGSSLCGAYVCSGSLVCPWGHT